jgi:hypothetical protein
MLVFEANKRNLIWPSIHPMMSLPIREYEPARKLVSLTDQTERLKILRQENSPHFSPARNVIFCEDNRGIKTSKLLYGEVLTKGELVFIASHQSCPDHINP